MGGERLKEGQFHLMEMMESPIQEEMTFGKEGEGCFVEKRKKIASSFS